MLSFHYNYNINFMTQLLLSTRGIIVHVLPSYSSYWQNIYCTVQLATKGNYIPCGHNVPSSSTNL